MTSPNAPKFFSASDFFTQKLHHIQNPDWKEVAADIANSLLASKGVRVYGEKHPGTRDIKQYSRWSTGFDSDLTHTALLIDIQPIVKKEPCKHFPKLIEGSGYGVTLVLKNNECRYCGVKLVAKWEAEK